MARIRTIKPEFWSSPGTASCEDPWARLLFIAMWNWADDMGRGTANAKELAGFAFPNDEKIESADIRRMLGGIRRAFGVEFYMVAGRPYYSIPSWDRHQKIDKRSGAKYPGPEEGEEWNPDPTDPPDQVKRNGSRYPAEGSADPAESAPSPRRILGAGTGEQGNRGTGEVTTPATARAAAKRDDLFDEFWAIYPKKVKKDDARKAWAAVLRKKVAADHLIDAARRHVETWRATNRDPQYIPYPSSWLRSGSYDDELVPAPLTLVPATPSLRSFEDYRSNGAATEAARILGIACILREQPPSDRTGRGEWLRRARVEWIDEHEQEIRAALTERKTG